MAIKTDPTRIHSEELIAGRRATFHIYYMHGKAARYSPCYETSEAAAEKWFEETCRELRMRNAHIVKIVATEGPLRRD